MSLLFRIKSFSQYLLSAQSKYYIHSPFVYELAESVIYDHRHYYAFDDINYIRAIMLNNTNQIQTLDLGAGQHNNNKGSQIQKTRRICDIAQNAAVPPQIGKLLFRLVQHFLPTHILELGTSLGIGTMYMAMSNKKAHITTIEGSPETAHIARQYFEKLNLNNISSKIGNFDHILPHIIQNTPHLDMVFFDGNHQYQPTMHYFELCLSKIKDHTIFVFDDIYWSSDMARAWKQIIQHPQVSLSIDLYRLGLVFFRTSQAKQNFKLYFI